MSGSVYGGLVYNALRSSNYNGPFNTITIPFKGVFKKLQNKIENDITRFAGQMILWPPNMTNNDIKKALDMGPRKLAQAISLKSQAVLNVFWSGDGVFGISLGVSGTIGKGLAISYSRTYYTQIWPSGPVDFK